MVEIFGNTTFKQMQKQTTFFSMKTMALTLDSIKSRYVFRAISDI